MLDCRENAKGVSFKVRLQPRASKNEIMGLQEDALKIRLTSPPVEGEANQACIEFFAELFNKAKSAVVITGGHKCRNKTLEIQGINKTDFLSVLEKYL